METHLNKINILKSAAERYKREFESLQEQESYKPSRRPYQRPYSGPIHETDPRLLELYNKSRLSKKMVMREDGRIGIEDKRGEIYKMVNERKGVSNPSDILNMFDVDKEETISSSSSRPFHRSEPILDRYKWEEEHMDLKTCSEINFQEEFDEMMKLNNNRSMDRLSETVGNETLSGHLILGIFSDKENCNLRNLIRKTWLNYQQKIFDHKFLIDVSFENFKSNEALIKENNIFNDLIPLNSSWSGSGVRYGEKIHNWFVFTNKYYPNHSLIGKCDDNIFICPENLIKNLAETNLDPNLYYGWEWFGYKPFEIIPRKVPQNNRATVISEKTRVKSCAFYADLPEINVPDGETPQKDLSKLDFTNYIQSDQLETKSKRVSRSCYFGQINEHIRMDDFLIFLGKDLVKTILEKGYCFDNIIKENIEQNNTQINLNKYPPEQIQRSHAKDKHECLSENKLYDTNNAGSSIGVWLENIQLDYARKNNFSSFFKDPKIKIIRRNEKIVHHADRIQLNYVLDSLEERKLDFNQNSVTNKWDFCSDGYLALQKTSFGMIKDLQKFKDLQDEKDAILSPVELEP